MPPRSTPSKSTTNLEPRIIKAPPLAPPFNSRHIPSLSEAQQLVQRHPDSAAAHYELARAYYAQKEYDKAIPHFEKCLALDPLLFRAYEYLSYCYAKKTSADWQEAERVLLRFQSLAYGSRYRYRAQINLGHFYLNRYATLNDSSDLEKAERAYHEALRTAPKGRGSQAAYGIGIVYARKHEWAQAKQWFEIATERAESPRHKAEALEALANLYAELGDQQKADTLIEEAKRIDPTYQARLGLFKM